MRRRHAITVALFAACCRTWNDHANQTLACWIAGLLPDGSNAYDPIDYAACAMRVTGLGKCADP